MIWKKPFLLSFAAVLSQPWHWTEKKLKKVVNIEAEKDRLLTIMQTAEDDKT